MGHIARMLTAVVLTLTLAAGDVAAFPGKLKLIATGFGEAATAVNNAAHYIDPDMKVFPGYSTTIMKQRERRMQKTDTTA